MTSVILKKVFFLIKLIIPLDNAVTCIEFDESGDYLAAGDKAGRVYVFNGSGEVISNKFDFSKLIYCRNRSTECFVPSQVTNPNSTI